jgi:hypothetical protein
MKVFKKILSVILTIILVVCIVSLIEISIESCIKGRLTIYGVTPIQIRSASMEASGIFIGDTVLTIPSSYKVGDIVAFRYGNDVWFHQIVSINNNSIQTKGSSNSVIDPFIISFSDIIGVYKGIKINLIVNYWLKLSIIIITYIIVILILLKYLLILIKKDKVSSSKQYKSKKYYTKHNHYFSNLLILFLSSICIALSTTAIGYAAPIVDVTTSSNNITYIAPAVNYKTTIAALYNMTYNQTSSHIVWYFNGYNKNGGGKYNPKANGSSLNSTGKNWAPLVNQDLANYLNVDISEVNTISWSIFKVSTNDFDIYFTYEDISKDSVGDEIGKVYRYKYDLSEFSYSTALVQSTYDGKTNLNTININSYSETNRVIFTIS